MNPIDLQTTRHRVCGRGIAGRIRKSGRRGQTLAGHFPFQYRSEAKALKILIRDLETRKVVDLIYSWSRRPGLVSLAAQRRAA